MKNISRIRFNPVTKEIEIEGSESFVKTYFDKIQAMISGGPSAVVGEPAVRAVKAAPGNKNRKVSDPAQRNTAGKVRKAKRQEPGAKRITHIDRIVSLIQGAPEGISTAELKSKTGFAEAKIWNIISRATKLGRIRKTNRGLYGGVTES